MSGVYFNPLKRIFLNLSGGTVTGDTEFTQGLHATYLSGDTIYSGSTELGFLVSNLIFSAVTSAPYLPLSGGTVIGDTTGQTLFMQSNIYPTTDNNSDIGTTIKRFRNLNIVNGISTNFTATTRVTTPEVMLGSTLVTEYNIILSGYTLEGGNW